VHSPMEEQNGFPEERLAVVFLDWLHDQYRVADKSGGNSLLDFVCSCSSSVHLPWSILHDQQIVFELIAVLSERTRFPPFQQLREWNIVPGRGKPDPYVLPNSGSHPFEFTTLRKLRTSFIPPLLSLSFHVPYSDKIIPRRVTRG
jgi:hypothetical protein